jgi:hypothetical protein
MRSDARGEQIISPGVCFIGWNELVIESNGPSRATPLQGGSPRLSTRVPDHARHVKLALMRMLSVAALLVILASVALAADSPAPADFGGVPLGASLRELKSQYPEASRNPDSDRKFQVYQVPTLHGANVKSPGAFQIYQGHVVGGQVLLDTHNAQYWLDAMIARHGKPDSCTYCNDPESATAVWHWENGVTLKIEGEMLTELTTEGTAQRSAWLARGDSDELADNGDEVSDEGGTSPAVTTSRKRRRVEGRHVEGPDIAAHPPAPPHQSRPPGLRGYYDDMNSRLEHWLGWSK